MPGNPLVYDNTRSHIAQVSCIAASYGEALHGYVLNVTVKTKGLNK